MKQRGHAEAKGESDCGSGEHVGRVVAVPHDAEHAVGRREKEVSETFSRDLFVLDPRQRLSSAGAHPPIAAHLIDLAATAIAGHFDVDPLRCEEYCSFRRVCRFNKAAG